MAVGALFGLVMQRVMLKATLEQNLVSIMIMTLGFGYVLHGAAALFFGSTGQILDTPLSSKEIAFDIKATDEALLGSVRGMSCEVIVHAGGQEIRQRTGNGTLRIDPGLR
jgi:branched-subunit amino acid ABC-type transport system permease component